MPADIDALIQFKITADKLRVIAMFTPSRGAGKDLTPDGVIAQLTSQNITTGIKRDTIEYICKSDKSKHSIIITEGTRPEVGEKARIEMYVDVHKLQKLAQKEDGGVDHYDRGEICSAKRNQELYRRIPPTIGAPGKNIYGEEIPGLPGKDLKLFLGRGTVLDEHDNNLVRALIDGEVYIKDGLISISEIHTVNGDVDFSTGNIIFKGTVKIIGSVKAGFKVESEGNIEVLKNVEDAEIIGGNDVIIHGGFVGTGEGIVQAKRDVKVKFVENQRIEADQDIEIGGESFHANLLAGRSISAINRKGAIVGGICQAKTTVDANLFGSVACPPTVIKIGMDPKLSEKIAVIETERDSIQESLDKIDKSRTFIIKQKKENNGVLTPDKKELFKKLEQAKKTFSAKFESLATEKKHLFKSHRDSSEVYAVAHKAVFPKVQVYIGNQWITIEDELGPSRFKIAGGEVVRLSK